MWLETVAVVTQWLGPARAAWCQRYRTDVRLQDNVVAGMFNSAEPRQAPRIPWHPHAPSASGASQLSVRVPNPRETTLGGSRRYSGGRISLRLLPSGNQSGWHPRIRALPHLPVRQGTVPLLIVSIWCSYCFWVGAGWHKGVVSLLAMAPGDLCYISENSESAVQLMMKSKRWEYHPQDWGDCFMRGILTDALLSIKF